MRRKEDAPPAGGRQNLRKPMPKDTRYKGESCFASDIVGRYREHMEKQRAAASLPRTSMKPCGWRQRCSSVRRR